MRAADDPFEVTVIPSRGRTVTAELADVDGDGRTDVLQAVTFGMPPDESRVLRIYPQRPDGSFPLKPEIEVPIPPASAAFVSTRSASRSCSALPVAACRSVQCASPR